MSILDFANYVAGNTTNYSNLTTQTSGLNAATVDKIRRMEELTNSASSSTSCFIGVNSPIMSAMSSASYIHQMAAILNEGMKTVNATPNSVFDSKPSYASSPAQAQAPVEAPKTEEAPKAAEATKTQATPAPKAKTELFTPEEKKHFQEVDDAFKRRAQSDKAEEKAAKKEKLKELVRQIAEAKSRPANQGDSYFFNYANKKVAELEKLFTEEELREIYKEIDNESKPANATDTKTPQNNANKEDKVQAENTRAEKIKNPTRGSELERLKAQYETVKDLEAKHITCGYLPSKGYLENRIREIESGEAEAILTAQINKLEEETKEYQGETHWYNFTKNSKLRELEDLKAQKANLY